MGFLGSFQGSRGRLAEQLGQAIGGGLGELTGSYFANNALNKVVNDPQLKDADAADRLSALQQKLAPFGQRGEKMLLRQLELDDKRAQKETQKLSNQYLLGAELTPQQKESLPTDVIAKKMQLDKPAKTSATNQPVPQDQAQKIARIINENPNANAEELGVKFAEDGVHPVYSNPYIESRRRLNEKTAERLDKRDEKTVEEVGSAPAQGIARGSFNTMVNGVLTGELDPGSSADFGRLFGVKAWDTPGAAAAATGSKEFLINSLDQIRGRPNQFLEQQVQKSLPEIGIPRNANAAKLRVVKFGIDATEKYDQIVNNLVEEGNYPPGKLKVEAQKQYREWEDGKQQELIKDLKDISKGNFRSLDEARYIETAREKLAQFPGYILIENSDGKVGGWKEDVPLPPGAKKI